MTLRIDIRVSDERLRKFVTLNEMIELQRGSLEAIRDVMPRFMWDESSGNYYPVTVEETDEGYVVRADPKATKIIGSLTIDKVIEAANAFKETVDKVATNPQSAAP